MIGPDSAWIAELTCFSGITELAPELADTVREAVASWVSMVDGGGPIMSEQLLRPGGRGARTKVVIREPEVCRIQISRLAPPVLGLVADIRGRQCIIDSDTGEPVSGNPEQQTWFFEFWNLVIDSPAEGRWRLEPGPDPHNPSCSCQASAGERDQPCVFLISCRFFEEGVRFCSDVAIRVRLMAPPTADEAVRLVLPAIYSKLTAFNGLSDWRPALTSVEVREQ